MALKTINVTQEDIRDGIQFDCEGCPIALAINRVLGDGCRCDVGETEIDFYISTTCVDRAVTPDVASNFITEFDLSPFDVEPFTFELEIPEAVLNQ